MLHEIETDISAHWGQEVSKSDLQRVSALIRAKTCGTLMRIDMKRTYSVACLLSCVINYAGMPSIHRDSTGLSFDIVIHFVLPLATHPSCR